MPFPNFLEPYTEQLKSYALDAIQIQATPLEKNQTLSLTESKFLGYPFLPTNVAYPDDQHGNPMVLWAQLNFAEIPTLEHYPTAGILQVFVSSTEWFDLKDFKILFHEDITQSIQTDFTFLHKGLYEESPIYCEHKLDFTKKVDYGSYEDHRFDIQFDGKDFFEYSETLNSVQEDALIDTFSGSGHKIGGYATFTQQDPRANDPELKEDLLLLQIDSDQEIMFGDSGVAHVFINKSDLINKNFDAAYLYWDCC